MVGSGKRIVITGGLGFIGSHFVDLLASRGGYDITVLDSDCYCATTKNLKEHMDAEYLSFVRGNVCDGYIVRKTVTDADVVVHTAAETHVDYSITLPRRFFETNVIGTVDILNACLDEGVEKVVIFSSDEVYGNTPEPADEDSNLTPASPYAASKTAADVTARAYYRTYGLPVCVVRPTNNYGPRQYPEKLIPKSITRILNGEKVPIYGDGRNTREWLWAGDTCRALLSLIEHPTFEGDVAGEAFNLGSGEEFSVLEIVRMVADRLGEDMKDVTERVVDRPGHVQRHRVDCGKIGRVTGWRSRVSMEDGLDRTVEWYRKKFGAELDGWWED